MSKSKQEMRDQAIMNSLETNNIEPDYFARERRENLKEQGFEVEVIELQGMTREQKEEYRRIKLLEKLEEERTSRKDRDECINSDIDAEGDPVLDSWLMGDWWVLPVEVDV